jgi:hypothetical protein
MQRHTVDNELPGEAIRRDGIRVIRVDLAHETARSRSSGQPNLSLRTRDAVRARVEPHCA